MADRSTSPTEVLLVEDEPLIAMYIEEALTHSGFSVSGPFETVDRAVEAANRFTGCAALVDLTLQGNDATLVTEILGRRRIPFIVMTGRDEVVTLPLARPVPVLRKPFLVDNLLEMLREFCPA